MIQITKICFVEGVIKLCYGSYMKKLILILIFLFFSNLTFADPKMELGLEVYNNKAQCGVCHVLQAAGSDGQIGPNLNQLKPLKSQVILAVKNGIGVMPPFEGVLSSEEIEAVSYFVSTSTNQ